MFPSVLLSSTHSLPPGGGGWVAPPRQFPISRLCQRALAGQRVKDSKKTRNQKDALIRWFQTARAHFLTQFQGTVVSSYDLQMGTLLLYLSRKFKIIQCHISQDVDDDDDDEDDESKISQEEESKSKLSWRRAQSSWWRAQTFVKVARSLWGNTGHLS